jgi:diguanylate cyclase (GGDEF)-like protein
MSGKERIRVVVADDDALFIEILTGMLAASGAYEIFQAASGEEIAEILMNYRIDCIIIDYDFGSENGFSIKQDLSARFPSVPPFVMLTGDGREGTVIKALRLGFGDYVPKRGLKPRDLFEAIGAVVERDRNSARDKSDLKRLAASARHDMATGAIARAQLDEQLGLLSGLAAEARADYALILVEFGQLREIREKYGLKAADRALRECAERLREAVRASDIWGRYASDAFLVIAKTDSAPDLLETLCNRIAAGTSARLDLEAAAVSLSPRVGGAYCGGPAGLEAPTLADLTRPVELALERARASGAPVELLVSRGVPPSTAPAAAGASAATSAASPSRASDRRREPRQRVFKKARILLIGSGGSIDCTVRNLSAAGAGLRTDAPFAVPERFDLLISGAGAKRRAQVRRQNGCDVAVEFTDG